MAPPARRLSLRGHAFAFHGIASRARTQWTRVLEARNATVLPHWRGHAASQVFVLTDWWVDTLPGAAHDGGDDNSVVCVTEYWLRESLKLGELLEPDAHPFFTPPAALVRGPLLLSYPMDYDEGTHATEATTQTTTLARLPCSPLHLYEDVVPMWPFIVAYLRKPTTTSAELARVVKLITGQSRHRLNCLETAIDDLLTPTDQQTFFHDVLPTMKTLVLDLPYAFRKSLPLLPPIDAASNGSRESTSRLHDASVHLSRTQLLALLSAMFLTVFPAQIHVTGVEFPWFNIEEMLTAPRSMPDFVLLKAHKIRTILEYFLQVVPRFVQSPEALEQEIVTFTRVAIDTPRVATAAANPDPDQEAIRLLQSLAVVTPTTTGDILSDVRIESNVLIEDLEAHFQIDFANKYAGGGVMNGGAVQEEIRFLLSPELLVACLVFAKLEANESFVIHGSERFSTYTGYGGTFRFAGSVQDTTPFEPFQHGEQRRRQSVVVGIDAISYGGNNVSRQYSRRCILRDLTKAVVGFAYPDATTTAWPVATGNWGCGVFRGDPELKFVIQWLAATLTGRNLVYVIFEQTSDLQEKVTTLLQECDQLHVPASWLVAFLMGLEEELADSGAANARPGSQRHPARSERRRTGIFDRRRQESVLDRAVAFFQAKAAVSRATACAGRSSDRSPTTAARPTTTVQPPPSPRDEAMASSSEDQPPPTVTPTRTPSNPRHRTSGAANGASGGSQLKQPKLTSFWK